MKALYRKNPVIVEAIELKENNFNEVISFVGQDLSEHYSNEVDFINKKNIKGFFIPTLEGSLLALIGDYIIKGVKGEFYPCKPDIFKHTYTKITTEDSSISLTSNNRDGSISEYNFDPTNIALVLSDQLQKLNFAHCKYINDNKAEMLLEDGTEKYKITYEKIE